MKAAQNFIEGTLHIEDFTRVRVNESDLTAILVETGAMPVPTKLQNPMWLWLRGSVSLMHN